MGLWKSTAQHGGWRRRCRTCGSPRNNSVLSGVSEVTAGLGIAPFPTPIGYAEGDLVQVPPGPLPELENA
jgi:DNA-binding transcriptional LysR family regulator